MVNMYSYTLCVREETNPVCIMSSSSFVLFVLLVLPRPSSPSFLLILLILLILPIQVWSSSGGLLPYILP